MARKGNQNWKFRLTHGRKKEFETPEELSIEIQDYFDWAVENPLTQIRHMNGKHGIEEVEVKLPRPFTLQGMATHIGITVQTFKNYGKLKANAETKLEEATTKKQKGEALKDLEIANDYFVVYTHARQIIFTQKYEGAAVGFFKENLIVRDLGIVDKQQHEVIVEQPLFPDAHKK